MMNEDVIYQFWLGGKNIPVNRYNALQTAAHLGVKTVLVTDDTLKDYVLEDQPLHEAYEYLPAIKKADYLKAYFCNFYGGGYADIKYFSKDNNWKSCFELLKQDSSIDVIGQKESPNGSPIVALNFGPEREKLISNGYFIARAHSQFTELWYKKVCAKLDEKLELVKHIRATDPYMQNNPNYPIRWAELCGEILHDIEYNFFFMRKEAVNKLLITGAMQKNYR